MKSPRAAALPAMETLVKIVPTKTGTAHYIKATNGVVTIEFKGGK